MSSSLRDHPGRDDADAMKMDQTPKKQPSAFGGEQDVGHDDDSAAAVARGSYNGTYPPDIINKGHLVVHYHYHTHNQPPSDKPMMHATVPQKRERDQDDKCYPETPNPFKTIDQAKAYAAPATNPFKRARLEEEFKTEKGDTEECKFVPEVTMEEASPTKKIKSQGKVCGNCGVRFTKRQNKPRSDGIFPCRRHTGKRQPQTSPSSSLKFFMGQL